MYVNLNASRSYLYNVARAFDRGSISSKDCSGVFLFTAENATQLALQAIQCLGKTSPRMSRVFNSQKWLETYLLRSNH